MNDYMTCSMTSKSFTMPHGRLSMPTLLLLSPFRPSIFHIERTTLQNCSIFLPTRNAGQSLRHLGHLPHVGTSRLAAFVGSDMPSAGEYHDADFTWEEHYATMGDIPAHIQEDIPEADGCLNGAHQSNGSYSSGSQIDGRPFDDTSWEAFHTTENATAKFYKERRYLLLEFPQLLKTEPPQHFVEIGCGVGSTILPVLKANPKCRATVTDLSPTAIRLLKQVASQAGVACDRLHGFATNSASLDLSPNPFQGLDADGVLLVFTLAALDPKDMPGMLKNAYQALRPGGLLYLRDHGVLDLTHCRQPAARKLGYRLYQRGDGTLSYFFTPEELEARMKAAGFDVLECKYVCVDLRNRKTNLTMKRVFVHGLFKKTSA